MQTDVDQAVQDVTATGQAERFQGKGRERGETAKNGTIIVALVDGEEVTLKRIRRKGNSVALEAANSEFETRIFGPDRVQVQGKLAGLLRQY